ncbi:MAG: hypothetical protein HKP55_10385 [Gammaproteobacteria bacterium]|nr:hypothetical protein [Gammaproteobacteria bacterium]
MQRKVILVLGTGRSGSTIVDLILGNDDRGMSCGEVYAYFRPWRKMHRHPTCSCSSGVECPVFNKMRELHENGFHENCLNTLNMDFIIDSSKEINWAIDVNLNSRIPVANILVYKEPIDLAYSFFKRGLGIQVWREHFLKYHKQLLASQIPFISINYKTFVESIDTELPALCSMLKIPYFEQKKAFWNHQSHHFFGSAGTREQIGQKSSLKVPEFSQDFQNQLEELKHDIENDKEVNDILEKLKEYDFQLFSSNDFVHSHFSGIRKPPFYYWNILKRWRNYIFPRPPPLSLQGRKPDSSR